MQTKLGLVLRNQSKETIHTLGILRTTGLIDMQFMYGQAGEVQIPLNKDDCFLILSPPRGCKTKYWLLSTTSWLAVEGVKYYVWEE